MGLEVEEDLKRKMVELNLAFARKKKSGKTGHVHLSGDADDPFDTIPVLENFCFVLALFRSRLSDNVLEGKALLEKLLHFEVDGNFPLYLHEYPECKDRDFSLDLLPIFHFILFEFRIALGESLENHLERLIGRILSHGFKMHAKRPLSPSSHFRLMSYVEPDRAPVFDPKTPEEWAEALITGQLVGSHSHLTGALEKWHPELCTFIGPQIYDRAEPRVTLFDLMMGHHAGVYSRRALEPSPIHLLASLIYPLDGEIVLTPKPVPCHAISPGAYTLYSGTREKLHSLCIDSQGSQLHIEHTPDGLQMLLGLPPKADDGQEAIELSLFMSLDLPQQILINGLKATTFQMGDTIDFIAEDLHLCFSIDVVSGEGRFFGHILRGNRPAQKGKNLKYEAYDWQIALRTIRRSERCSLALSLRF